ncbi:hypothetical protein D3C87_83170 [compost metagenome]
MKEKEATKRTRIVGVRLTSDEFEKIEKKWKNTTFRKLSDYLRAILLNGRS